MQHKDAKSASLSLSLSLCLSTLTYTLLHTLPNMFVQAVCHDLRVTAVLFWLGQAQASTQEETVAALEKQLGSPLSSLPMVSEHA
jgi:hypothetical protein